MNISFTSSPGPSMSPRYLFIAVLEHVDSKLQDLKRSISEDQKDCVRSVVKKVKEDNAIKWNKVGNEKQLKLNESLEAKFDSSIAFIKREWSFSLAFIDKKKLNKAKQELEEVRSFRTFCLNVKIN